MSQIIPLGIGSPAAIPQLVLTGLSPHPTQFELGNYMIMLGGQAVIESISQNVVYALPARAIVIFSEAQLEISNHTNSGWQAIAGTTTGVTVSGGYVRCTTGDTVISCKLG